MDEDKAVLADGGDGSAAAGSGTAEVTAPEQREAAQGTEGNNASPGLPEGAAPEHADFENNLTNANAEEGKPQTLPAAEETSAEMQKEAEAGAVGPAHAEEEMPPAAEAVHAGKTNGGLIMYAAAVILVAIILYGFYNQLQYVAVAPNNLPQAGNARFYEGFVYNESHLIPSSCLVFSYDPTLFNINNRTAAQLGYLYDRQQYDTFSKEYSCLVVDYGYWCYTPNNICTYAKSDFILSTIANATYNQTGQTYSFYRVVGVNAS